MRLEHGEVRPSRAAPFGDSINASPLTHKHVAVGIRRALAARAAVRAVIALAGAARDEPRPLVAVAAGARRPRVVAQLRRQLLAPLARIAVAAYASAEQLVAPAAAGAAAPAAARAIVHALAERRQAWRRAAEERGLACVLAGMELKRRAKALRVLRASRAGSGSSSKCSPMLACWGSPMPENQP